MKKPLILLAIGLLNIPWLFSQKISNVDFQQAGNDILISYALSGLKLGETANVSIYVSIDGGKTFTGPLKEVKGDVGENVKPGAKKFIQWAALREIPDFGGDVVFNVRASILDKAEEKVVEAPREKPVEEEKPKEKKPKPTPSGKHLFIGLNGSNYAPFGVSFGGGLGKWGGYLSGRMNTNLFTEVAYETDGLRVIDYDPSGYYIFGNTEKIKRLSVTGGVTYQVHPNIGIYAGGGLSKYELLWQIQEYDYSDNLRGEAFVSHNRESFLGFEMETGLLFQYKKIILGMGASSPNLQWFEGVVTLGFNLF